MYLIAACKQIKLIAVLVPICFNCMCACGPMHTGAGAYMWWVHTLGLGKQSVSFYKVTVKKTEKYYYGKFHVQE